MPKLLLMALRTLIMYIFLLFAMRLAGKRELGQVSPFDFVVSVLIGELAAIPLSGHRIPLWDGIIPILTIIGAQLSTAYICLWSPNLRAIISGRPKQLISGGQIQEKELRRLRFNMNDLLSKLRQQGSYNIAAVECAILEDTGHLSVVLKSQERPVTPKDLNLATKYEGLPWTLILDGMVDYGSLKQAQLDYPWLQQQLKANGFKSPRDVLLATLETDGQTHFYPKEQARSTVAGQPIG